MLIAWWRCFASVISLPAYARYLCCFFFFMATATPEIYTLSLHDALPILSAGLGHRGPARRASRCLLLDRRRRGTGPLADDDRSEEHMSELQSLTNLVCRLLLEKKKQKNREEKEHRTTTPGGERAQLDTID